METIPTSRAELELPDLIHRAAAGETIVIEAPTGERVRLQPEPVTVGAGVPDRVPGSMKGKIEVPARLFEPMSEDELKLWYGEEP